MANLKLKKIGCKEEEGGGEVGKKNGLCNIQQRVWFNVLVNILFIWYWIFLSKSPEGHLKVWTTVNFFLGDIAITSRAATGLAPLQSKQI